MKKMMWVISFFSLIGTSIVLQIMPENIPMHYDIAGNIDRWESKFENLIFPTIIILVSLFWTLLISHYEKKANNTEAEKESVEARSNAKVLGIVGVSQAAMFTVMQGYLLYGSYQEAVSGATRQAVDIGKVSNILLGVLCIILGNNMTKTRVNSVVGVRISWSMYNDHTWRKTNRFGAFALIIAGILTIIATVFIKSSLVAMMATIGGIILATTVTVIYAHKVYVLEIKAEKGEK